MGLGNKMKKRGGKEKMRQKREKPPKKLKCITVTLIAGSFLPTGHLLPMCSFET